MPYADLPLDRLRSHVTTSEPPAGLADFWQRQVATLTRPARAAAYVPVDTGFVAVDTFDVTFAGADEHPVRAWLHVPAARSEPLPAVVQFQGYDGGRGLPQQDVFWASAGYAQLVVDSRGQGSGWSVGDTPDPVGSDPAQPGFLTKGIGSTESYYYRRLFLDAVRAVEVARAHPQIDPARVAVAGGSQGGGLAIAAGAIARGVWAVLADVPFLSDFPRALQTAQRGPYLELVRYLAAHRSRVDAVLAVLSHFDVAHLAALATAPALFSVALMDEICPPSTVYAAFNAYAGPKVIREYPYNDHEGGDVFQKVEQLRWLNAMRS